jgi:hypothetical protein
LDPLYATFKHQLEALIRERIAPQYQNLNFKEMRLVQHLGPILNDIDSKYFITKTLLWVYLITQDYHIVTQKNFLQQIFL